MINTDLSLNKSGMELHQKAIMQIIKVIENVDLTKVKSKTLAFLISFYGKNCISDEKVNELKWIIYNHFINNQANIFDIVETFNALMNIKQLSIDDLKKTKLDKNFQWANDLST